MTVTASNAVEPGVVVTPVAVGTPLDVESQKQAQPGAPGTSAAIRNPSAYPPVDDTAGKGMGIAMFIVILVGLICNWIVPIVSFVCIIAAIVLASIICCSCCCASDYNLPPHVKRFSTATLVSLCLVFVVQIIYLIAVSIQMGTEASNTGSVSQRSVDSATTGAIVIGVLSLIFNIMALIFAGIFTWGRNCCAPSA